MTAVRSRRTRNTYLALLASLVALVTVATLGWVGARTLADSTAGSLADGQRVETPTRRLPHTETALIGVIDDDDHLTSVAVAVLEPTGVGGSLVGLAATADASSGNNTVLAPLDAVLAVSGPQAFAEAAERLTGLSFDVIEVVDQRRFVQLVTPLGDLPAEMPITLRDSSTQEEWPEGEIVLSSASAARAITARDDSIADWYLEPGRSAVWEAVADRVGAGIGSITPVASDLDVPPIETLDEFIRRLFADPVEFRVLSFVVIDDDRLDEQLPDEMATAFGRSVVPSVVAHNRSETLMAFGAVAPGRLGAPVDAPTFRVISGYAEAELEGLGKNRSDVMKLALDRLLFTKANIVAVTDLPGAGAPDITAIRVADPLIVDDVTAVYGDLFGASEVTVAAVVTDGVDIEIELGYSFIEQLRAEMTDAVAGSDDNDQEDADSEDGDSDDGEG